MPLSQEEANRLTELSVRIGELDRKIDFVLNHLQLRYVDPHAQGGPMAEVMNWLRKGNKMEAVKAYRQATNAGMAEAMKAIEAIEQGKA